MTPEEEYVAQELNVLLGARITKLKVGPDELGGSRNPMVELTVRFKEGMVVNGCKEGTYQVWMDEEGGPGHLALIGTSKQVAT